MLRRIVNLLLIGLGGVPLVWALRSYAADPRRAAAVAALAVIGIVLNLTGLVRRDLNIRGWLRVLACGLAGLAAIAALLLWHQVMYDALPSVPEDDTVLRAKIALAGGSLLWIALGLAYVAAGWLDAYFHLALKPWDAAAGMLLVAEAGGRCTTLTGESYYVGWPGCLATNGLIHEELLTLMRVSLG